MEFFNVECGNLMAATKKECRLKAQYYLAKSNRHHAEGHPLRAAIYDLLSVKWDHKMGRAMY